MAEQFMDDPLLRLEIRNLDAKALLWRAVADGLAEALRNELTISKKNPLPSAREALAAYDAAQFDGQEAGDA